MDENSDSTLVTDVPSMEDSHGRRCYDALTVATLSIVGFPGPHRVKREDNITRDRFKVIEVDVTHASCRGTMSFQIQAR